MGTYEWVCSESGGVKTCTPKCSDGYDQLGISASCGESGEWVLDSGADKLDQYEPGCWTCSAYGVRWGMPNGGHWECDVSDQKKKTCLPKCDSGRFIKGALTCDRFASHVSNSPSP